MTGPTNECPECGHSPHGGWFEDDDGDPQPRTCLVIWMGEQCDCAHDSLALGERE